MKDTTADHDTRNHALAELLALLVTTHARVVHGAARMRAQVADRDAWDRHRGAYLEVIADLIAPRFNKTTRAAILSALGQLEYGETLGAYLKMTEGEALSGLTHGVTLELGRQHRPRQWRLASELRREELRAAEPVAPSPPPEPEVLLDVCTRLLDTAGERAYLRAEFRLLQLDHGAALAPLGEVADAAGLTYHSAKTLRSRVFRKLRARLAL